MGAMSGLLGTAGGVNGTGISGPQGTNITSPVTGAQVNAANTQVGNTAQSQQALLSALGANGGVNNQANVMGQTQGLANQMGGGLANQNAAATAAGTLNGQLAQTGGAAGLGGAVAGQTALNTALGQNNAAQAIGSTMGAQNTLNTQLAANNGAQAMGAAMGQQNALNTNLAGVGGTQALGSALQGQGTLANQLAGAGGIQAQQAAIAGLQGNAAQLQNVANGTGPNPAQAMLNQQTGQNVQQQAALMAGQRGAGANIGLMARQAAQQGAATQQQAVGQGATMQAQQSLNALNQQAGVNQALAGAGANLTSAQQAALGQQAGTAAQAASLQQQGVSQASQQAQAALAAQQAGIGQSASQAQAALAAQQAGIGQQGQLSQAAIAAQQAGINQQAGIGAAQVGQQQTQQQMLAQQAQNQVANQVGVQQQAAQNAISNAGQQMGALGQQNATNVSMQSNINAANAGLANTTMQGQQGMIGGLMNSIGSAGGLLAGGGMVEKPRRMAKGGKVRHFDEGGGVGPLQSLQNAPTSNYTPPPMSSYDTAQVPMVNEGAAPAGATQGNPNAQSSFGKFASSPAATAGNAFMMNDSAGAAALYKGVSSMGTSVGKALKSVFGGSGSDSDSFQPTNSNAAGGGGDSVPMADASNVESSGTGTGDYLGGATSTADFLGGMSRGGLMDRGGHVTANNKKEKAVKKGNSYANDKIDAKLSEGEIVIPRSVTMGKDPIRGSAEFVRKVLAQRRAKK